MRILAINCGSSSLKFAVIELIGTGAEAGTRRLFSGAVSAIGGEATFHLQSLDGSDIHDNANAGDHRAAMHLVLDKLAQTDMPAVSHLDGIGHRVVHGGPRLFAPVVIDDAVIERIEAASQLAPLHNDAALSAIEAARQYLPNSVPMVAVFDTSFYEHLPPQAARYAIPPDVADAHGIRRYGFHGLAHRFMAERCAQLIGRPLAELKLITLQLGGGCSATAIKGGRAIDTSMGFTPLEGLMMGTRSGDIDPAVVRFLCDRTQMYARQVEQWLNHDSGLRGISGRSADVVELLKHESEGDPRAGLALTMFCYRVRKYLGAYLAAVGGADAVVFGGGIGEHAAELRARICEPMAWLGLQLDTASNRAAIGQEQRISTSASKILVYVIPVDEQTLIARDTGDCLRSSCTTLQGGRHDSTGHHPNA